MTLLSGKKCYSNEFCRQVLAARVLVDFFELVPLEFEDLRFSVKPSYVLIP